MSADDDLPRGSTRRIASLLLDVVQEAPGLRWMHGQGSSILGFNDSSDIDCVLVWTQVPKSVTLPLIWGPRLDRHDHVVLEQATVAGRDLDLLHVPEWLFRDWIHQIEHGNGWQSDSWPSPLYSASGLAHGVVLHDPDGLGSSLRLRLQHPPRALRTSVHDALTAALPLYLAELVRCVERNDRWLHQHVCGQLLKLVYTGWFLAEGRLPPFPKSLPDWYGRFDVHPAQVELEERYWTASSLASRTTALEGLCQAVLDLGPGPD